MLMGFRAGAALEVGLTSSIGGAVAVDVKVSAGIVMAAVSTIGDGRAWANWESSILCNLRLSCIWDWTCSNCVMRSFWICLSSPACFLSSRISLCLQESDCRWFASMARWQAWISHSSKLLGTWCVHVPHVWDSLCAGFPFGWFYVLWASLHLGPSDSQCLHGLAVIPQIPRSWPCGQLLHELQP